MQEFSGMTVSTPIPLLTAELPLAHVDALPVGTRLAEFEVQSLLGVGGFGMVYRAYDHSLHRTVAIKEYMPSALASRQAGLAVSIRSSVDQTSYQSGLASFVAEARLLAQFDHPSLVKVYRFWEAHNTAYMVMPLYSGMTLKQARKQMEGPPPEAWLRTVLWSILQALQLLHENQTLHRDVSPDNIFLQDIGPPVLLDLGAARRAISENSQKLTAILKVNYAPIEQYADAEGLTPGPWSDLYSLAGVVYGCLRNEAPLSATARLVRDSMPSMDSVALTVEAYFGQAYSPAFVNTIRHALAIPPAERPQSVQAFMLEMALVAPKELAKFDWRAGLGPGLLSAVDASSQSHGRAPSPAVTDRDALQRSVSTHEATTVRMASDRVDADERPDFPPTQVLEDPVLPLTGRHGQRMAWMMAVVLLGLAGMAYWKMSSPHDPAPLVVESKPPASAAPSSLEKPATEVVRPAPVPPVVPGAPPKAKPMPKTKAAAVSDPTGGGAAESSVSMAENVPPGPVKQAPANPPRARPELCLDSNFITRPMCIHLECKKPEHAHLAVCAEDRKRYPDN